MPSFHRNAFFSILWIVLFSFVGVLWGVYNNNISFSKGGDFISGICSPLAIFWLIAIYRQQQEEMGKILVVQKEIATLDAQKINISKEQNTIAGRQNVITENQCEPLITAKFVGYTRSPTTNVDVDFKLELINHKTNCQLIEFHTPHSLIKEIQFIDGNSPKINVLLRDQREREAKRLWEKGVVLVVFLSLKNGNFHSSLTLKFVDDLKREWQQKINFFVRDPKSTIYRANEFIPPPARDVSFVNHNGVEIGLEICKMIRNSDDQEKEE